ncbi:MAG: ATP-binding cassette domain-containing protein [Pseudomonadota bacterium]
MLHVDNLTLTQGNFTLSADWRVPEGRRVAVIGPSGAGKSTLLGALAGFVPMAGRLSLDGQPIHDSRPEARGIAMLFQDSNLFPHLTLRQNVGLGLRARLRLTAEEHAQVDAALARVGLDGLGDRRPGAVSGGQQSRVALARVLVQRKKLLLLDEPFAALGPALRVEMLDLVARLTEETGATLLMVTHDPKDALRIAQDVIWLDAGVAHAPQAAGPLLSDPPPSLKAYLGSG